MFDDEDEWKRLRRRQRLVFLEGRMKDPLIRFVKGSFVTGILGGWPGGMSLRTIVMAGAVRREVRMIHNRLSF